MDEMKTIVSACVVSYNQAQYIERCLQSLLEQREGEGYILEILVSDDGSTDGTRDLINQLDAQHPGHIKSFFQDKNLGGAENYCFIHRQARGEFVVHLDGDDFALPGKLEAQLQYLKQHPECIAVVHKLEFWDEAGNRVGRVYPDQFRCPQYDLTSLVQDHPVFLHSSLMYRKGGLREVLDHSPETFVDFYIYVHLASLGKFGVIDKVLGGYTQGVGVGTRLNLVHLVAEALDYARKLGLSQQDHDIKLSEQYFVFAKKAFVDGQIVLFHSLIGLSIKTRVFSLSQVALFLFRRFPGLISRIREVAFRPKHRSSDTR